MLDTLEVMMIFSVQMMEMVTFLLTCVYALNAMLRTREVYRNQGTVLPSKDARKKFRHCVTVLVYIGSW
jgi:hypothetical protein